MSSDRSTEEGGGKPEDRIEEHAGGEIRERRGRVNLWLGLVYLVLFVWALYYLFAYWGGLGPGLDY